MHASAVAACRMVAADDIPEEGLTSWSRNVEKVARSEVWSSGIQDDDDLVHRLGCHAFVAKLAERANSRSAERPLEPTRRGDRVPACSVRP